MTSRHTHGAASLFVAMCTLTSISACDADPSEPDQAAVVFSSDQLRDLEFQELTPGRALHTNGDFSVEVLHGREGAALYLDELDAQLDELGARHDSDSDAQLEIAQIVEEMDHIEDILAQDTWDEPSAVLGASVCGVHYSQDYEFRPALYKFSMEVTTTVLANGVGPKPPYAINGYLKAKSIINPGPNQIKNYTQVSFLDTWFQSHSATASSRSPLHYDYDLQDWQVTSLVVPQFPGCVGFGRIIVAGRASWGTIPIVDSITVI